MLLKILERLGRKKLVLDRGKSHPDYKNAKPWTANAQTPANRANHGNVKDMKFRIFVNPILKLQSIKN